VFPISAVHGRGVDELLEAVVRILALPPPARPSEEDDVSAPPPRPSPGGGGGRSVGGRPVEERPLRVAFVGKPNAGKSSLMNRLVGAERSLVHDVPGTTTDPVDTPFSFGGTPYVLVDTAGIRRKARIEVETEKISVSMALAQIRRADVAVLVVDAAAGASDQDARIAGIIEETGRAVVVALNKADLIEGGPGGGAAVRRRAADVLHFVPYAPVVLLSALRGDGVGDLLARVDQVATQHRHRISTPELDTFFAEVCETHPPPIHRGRPVRIHYLTQGGTSPPTFLLFANAPQGVSESYRRFVQNQLRARYGFEGTPVRVVIKAKRGREAKPPAHSRNRSVKGRGYRGRGGRNKRR
jgi:GTPase